MNFNLSPAPHIHAKQSARALMGNVLIALIPCVVAGYWAFGPRALLLMAVSTLSAVLFEALFQKLAGQPVRIGDLSAAVTGLLLGLNLPVSAPWWLPVIGSAFAVAIVKGLFGGLGDNFINPALAARALLLASWPKYMTNWQIPNVDCVTGATPLVNPTGYSTMDLFMGRIPGTIGEVCKLAILIGFAYLLVTKTISWRIPVTMVVSAFVFLWLMGKDPAAGVLSGGLLFAAVFMATDYATCPMSAAGQFVYAALAGLLVALLRCHSSYPEGATYAILTMNAASGLIDHCLARRVYGYKKEGKKHV